MSADCPGCWPTPKLPITRLCGAQTWANLDNTALVTCTRPAHHEGTHLAPAPAWENFDAITWD